MKISNLKSGNGQREGGLHVKMARRVSVGQEKVRVYAMTAVFSFDCFVSFVWF